MAEFAAIATGILTDEEFLTLPADFQHVWLVLCISQLPGKCGIFKRGALVISQQSCRTVEQVNEAFTEFERLGWIKRDGDYTWIVSRIKHREHNAAWRAGALHEAASMLGKTTLADECIAHYQVPQKSGATPAPTAASNHITAQHKKHSTEKRTAAVAAAPSGAKPDKPLTEDQTKCLPAGEKAIKAIQNRCEERGVKPPIGATVKDAAIAFDALHRNEGIAPREALAALLWLLTDDFWQDLLLSPQQWRKRAKGPGTPVKFFNAHAKWVAAGRPAPGQPALPPAAPIFEIPDTPARQRNPNAAPPPAALREQLRGGR